LFFNFCRVDRRRFKTTAIHEIAHLVLHNILPKLPNWGGVHLRRDTKNYDREEDPEEQAWLFTESFLLPQEYFTKKFYRCASNKDYIRILADKFDVNPAFIRQRIRTLNLKRPSARNTRTFKK
jgi:Zn-dependent peptidase ImmA (M78 family)